VVPFNESRFWIHQNMENENEKKLFFEGILAKAEGTIRPDRCQDTGHTVLVARAEPEFAVQVGKGPGETRCTIAVLVCPIRGEYKAYGLVIDTCVRA
jgi:hypothetical protein